MEEIKNENIAQPETETKSNETEQSASIATPGVHLASNLQDEYTRRDQYRTRKMKKKYLNAFAESMGVVERICEKIGLNKKTYYHWIKVDPDFVAAIDELSEQKNNIAADILWEKVAVSKETAAVKYYLDRRHPGYKPRVVNEFTPGERSWEDMYDEQVAKNNAELNPPKDDTTGQQVNDRNAPEDQEQAGPANAVHTEPVPNVLLGTTDTPKSDSEGSSVGAK